MYSYIIIINNIIKIDTFSKINSSGLGEARAVTQLIEDPCDVRIVY